MFGCETATDSIVAVLHKEPDWTALPPATPPSIQLLPRKCLAKDLNHRLHDIGDARVDLEPALANPGTSSMLLAGVAVTVKGHERGKRKRLAAKALNRAKWLP